MTSPLILDQLDKIAAAIVDQGHAHRPGIRRFPDEFDTQSLQPFVLAIQIIDLKGGGGDSVSNQCLLVGPDGRMLAGLE
jgi:hypothetical protein